MSYVTAFRSRPKSRKAASAGDDKPQRTRAALIDAAGHVFAEKGFDRATGKEICARAGANVAAINDYFGGIEGLYAAVLRLAHGRVVSVDHLQAVVAHAPDARRQLEAILGMLVRAITGPASTSWIFRVIGREVVAPSRVFSEMRDKEIFRSFRILRPMVAELMDLPPDHPAVARACVDHRPMRFAADRRPPFLEAGFSQLRLRRSRGGDAALCSRSRSRASRRSRAALTSSADQSLVWRPVAGATAAAMLRATAARSAGRSSTPIFCASVAAIVTSFAQRTTDGAGNPALRKSVIGTSDGHDALFALVIMTTHSSPCVDSRRPAAITKTGRYSTAGCA